MLYNCRQMLTIYNYTIKFVLWSPYFLLSQVYFFLAVKLGNIDFQKCIIQQKMMEKEVFFHPDLLIYFIVILV